uniref:Uncharacterized protein n=1 Tax=viral metagenome TaxID=1070528 RepID=A0A6C0KCE7_9ZZZZ
MDSIDQSMSPFRWMTDGQTNKTTATLSTGAKNKFSKLPPDLVGVSTELMGTSKKLTKTLDTNTTDVFENKTPVAIPDAGVTDLDTLATRRKVNSYYTFQEGKKMNVYDTATLTDSEKVTSSTQYEITPMNKNMFNTRPGVMIQNKWTSEPQLQRGGINSRYTER